MPLDPDIAVSVRLDAICSRNRYTADPAAVIDEITRVVGDRTTVRDETIGTWVGFNRDDYTATLCDALLEAFPGARAYEHVGIRRRGGTHSTSGFRASRERGTL